jgi:hypothetical protein
MPRDQPFFYWQIIVRKEKEESALGNLLKEKRVKKMNKSPFLVGFTKLDCHSAM